LTAVETMIRKRDRWDSSSEDEENQVLSRLPSKIHKDNLSNTSIRDNKPGSKLQTSRELKKDDTVSGDLKVDDADITVNGDERGITAPNVDLLPKHNPLLSGCRSVYNCYERLARLDEGTYGVVWKARDMATNEVVALKQIKFDPVLMKEGFQMAALREIGVLLALNHECIVSVKEMVVGDSFDKVFMAMEVCFLE